MKFNPAIGETFPDLFRAQAAGLFVGRVEPEVVPEDEPAGTQHPQHIGADLTAELRVEDGRECRELQNQVESPGREGQAGPIGIDEVRTGQGLAGMAQAVGEQVYAVQVFGGSPKRQELGQHSPAAAAHFQDF